MRWTNKWWHTYALFLNPLEGFEGFCWVPFVTVITDGSTENLPRPRRCCCWGLWNRLLVLKGGSISSPLFGWISTLYITVYYVNLCIYIVSVSCVFLMIFGCILDRCCFWPRVSIGNCHFFVDHNNKSSRIHDGEESVGLNLTLLGTDSYDPSQSAAFLFPFTVGYVIVSWGNKTYCRSLDDKPLREVSFVTSAWVGSHNFTLYLRAHQFWCPPILMPQWDIHDSFPGRFHGTICFLELGSDMHVVATG